MNVEEELEKIKERNSRVELDKMWETSWTRRLCICVLTYIIVVCYSYIIKRYDNIFLSSLVPVIGFCLSTLSFSLKKAGSHPNILRKFWIRMTENLQGLRLLRRVFSCMIFLLKGNADIFSGSAV